MRNYVKPEFYVEQFMPNEYISACEWIAGEELSAECGNQNITIKLGTYQGGDVWSATPVDENGNAVGGSEMLYPINGRNNYAFCGSIYDGHSGSNVSGEFVPHTASTPPVGSSYGHGTVCDCSLVGQSGASVTTWHHHLTNVRTTNHS